MSEYMSDVVYVVVIGLFFAVSAVYVWLCDRLQEGRWKQ